jgi:hypothetical protein
MICLLSLIIQKKKEKLYTPETVKEDIALWHTVTLTQV